MKKNHLTCDKETCTNIHHGLGNVICQNIFSANDFNGAWDFVMKITMEPNSTIGTHGLNNTSNAPLELLVIQASANSLLKDS